MMEKKKNTSDRIINLLAVLTFLVCAVSYFFIEGKIGIHFNSRWEIDRYVRKEYIFVVGMLPGIILLLYDWTCSREAAKKFEKKMKGNHKFRSVLGIFMMAMSILITATGIYGNLNYKLAGPIILGSGFVLIGNYLPTVKRNHFIGVRTSYSMYNDECFRKSNRFGGYSFALLGVFMIFSGLIRSNIISKLSILFLIATVIANIYYSYFVYQKVRREEEDKRKE